MEVLVPHGHYLILPIKAARIGPIEPHLYHATSQGKCQLKMVDMQIYLIVGVLADGRSVGVVVREAGSALLAQ